MGFADFYHKLSWQVFETLCVNCWCQNKHRWVGLAPTAQAEKADSRVCCRFRPLKTLHRCLLTWSLKEKIKKNIHTWKSLNKKVHRVESLARCEESCEFKPLKTRDLKVCCVTWLSTVTYIHNAIHQVKFSFQVPSSAATVAVPALILTGRLTWIYQPFVNDTSEELNAIFGETETRQKWRQYSLKEAE